MEAKYNPKSIEPKWQKAWDEKGIYKTSGDLSKPKFYALVEFPYPSGDGLHVGHSFTYIVLDILARKKRLEGYRVLYPMGWDAFGLPTENYAVKTGTHPSEVTLKNTDRFRNQMKSLSLAYDWDLEINTTDPSYYKWTQWIFLQLLKKGLAYKAKVPVGWCPSCKIVLANEEIVGGCCERCGAKVARRLQEQWMLKITDYADRLAADLDLVDYPEFVKLAQRNWIGRSEGVEISFPVKEKELKIGVFTTRPDTMYGVTFMVVAPEYGDLKSLVTEGQHQAVFDYVEKAKSKSELERISDIKNKTGVFTGSYGINPLNGEEFPIWVADYVVASYGTGAVMGVPAYDKRDKSFVEKYSLGFKDVPLENMEEITEKIVKAGFGKKRTSYHLRDWVFSRQHYWGEPIPVVNCGKCQIVPLDEKDLPLELPRVEKYEPTETGESPLASIPSWVNTKCPKCGGPAKRETDTMPNWAGSSWYYLRFCDPRNSESFANYEKLDYWMPVDIYLGGAEHTTLHLLYSRFWHKFLFDLQLVPGVEPYKARRQHGVILAENGEKMSKSRGNVINPDDMIKEFGLDALRLYMAFMGPYDQTMPWSTTGVDGTRRFLVRVWRLFLSEHKVTNTGTPALLRSLQKTIKKVGADVDKLKNNTAVAALMSFVKEWERGGSLSSEDAGKFLVILAPFAPHITEELWAALGRPFSIHNQAWPEFDKNLVFQEEVVVAVQVDG
ncbi:MAG: class I tRNA ligase family protein, partial [bacterium]